jgi:flagellar hook-associated protein 1 FlgK
MSSSLFNIATRAMLTHQSAMTVVSHNIANASVPGYSRQQAELATTQGMFDGAGYFGRGVHVQTVTRSYNEFLTRQAAVARAQLGFDNARSEQLSRLEQVFLGGEQGLGAATNEFLNAMVDLASHPQDSSARQVVLSSAGELAARYERAAGQLDELQAGVTQDVTAQVARVNEIATQIAAVNGQIVSQQGSGHAPNDLLDQRDRLVSELSEMMSVSTIPASDGSMGVFIGGGQRLVLGNQAATVSAVPDAFDRTRMALAIEEVEGPRPLTPDLLGSGSLAGLMRFQNDDLVDARNLVGQMATSLAYAVNEQQALGLDLGSPPSAGAPIFGIGAPQVLAAQTNARNGAGAFTSNVTLAVEDARQLVASEYSLAHDGSAWQLTRLSDGLTRSVNSGDVVDGLRIDLGTPAPTTSDRFLLQPLTRAARSMSVVLDDPRGIAAASPVTAAVNSANTGTGSVAALRVVDPAVNPQLTATITFDNDTGDYTWELRDRSTNALASSGTGTWTAGQPIALNGTELDLAGVPKTGDAFTIEQTAYPASNNGNALAFARLRDLGLVGANDDGSGGVTGGRTFTDAWAAAIADIGVRVQGSSTAAQISAGSAEAAQTALSNATGVNLDEEAAKLMQIQQSYQAAAKVLQTAQTIFDTLLSIGN